MPWPHYHERVDVLDSVTVAIDSMLRKGSKRIHCIPRYVMGYAISDSEILITLDMILTLEQASQAHWTE